MTINELLERRYSKELRKFCGLICFISGVLNMGIFPIVTGRFIVYFTEMPLQFNLLGLTLPTIPIITGLLVAVALLLVFLGGQVSLIFTDFIQWSVIMFMFLVVGFVTYRIINWNDISRALQTYETPKSLLDPFMPTSANAFGLWYVIMFTLRGFYNVLSWAPNTVKSQSASDAKEAKLMWILSYIRYGSNIGLLFAAVACLAFMKLPEFSSQAQEILTRVNAIPNEVVRTEMTVPIFLAFILPPAAKGLFVAAIICAAISTLDTYFLSWAGVFAQDVVGPRIKRTMKGEQRLKILRWSTVGVAVFVYVFSILWKPTEYIWMYFAITGAIYTGGAGAVILGGLYWKKGTTKAAWTAMITGSGMSVIGIVALQLFSRKEWWPDFINGMSLSVLASILAVIVYIVISLLSEKQDFDIQSLLSHGQNEEKKIFKGLLSRLKEVDKFVLAVGLFTSICIIFILGALWYSRTHNISTKAWLNFWKYYSISFYLLSIPITIWFFIGSVFDIVKLIKRLKTETVNELDDGQVHETIQRTIDTKT
jgi:SSS family solute:Na+ symporter